MVKRLFLPAVVLLATLLATLPAAAQLTFEGSYIGDAYYNARGGLATGGGFMGMAGIAASLDLAEAGLWRGGEVRVNGASIHGKSLTENYLGDLQVASNIDAGEHAYLHELWFRQRLGRLSVTAGLQDLNAEFMVSEGGGQFVNSSFGTPSVIALGVPVPIFPLTGLGVALRWDVSDRWAVQGAVFDGVQTGFERNPHNVRWALGRGEGTLAMGEVHLHGRFKIGGYYHSGERNWGVHGSVDQPLGQRVGLFAQAVAAPSARNDNDYYLGLGVNLSGVFLGERGRGDGSHGGRSGGEWRDGAGIALAHAGLHGAAHRHETAVELYYRVNMGEHLSFQPDIQWIINPSGGGEKLPDALVGIMRLAVSF